MAFNLREDAQFAQNLEGPQSVFCGEFERER